MVTAWTIARTEVTRLLRDRTNLFFVFVFPLLLVLVIGAQFGGGGQVQVGIVAPDGDTMAQELIATVDATDGVETVTVPDAVTLREDVARGRVSAGLVVPAGYEQSVVEVEPVEVSFIGRPDATGGSLRSVVAAAIAQQATPGRAALLVAEAEVDAELPALRAAAVERRGQAVGVDVVARTLGTDELSEEFAGLGQFDLGASTQLFLFTFLTSLSGGAALIQLRQLGIAHRMLASPTSMSAIVGGLVGGRLLVALVQAAYIIAATLLLFQVDWGAPSATIPVVVLFSVVSAAAGVVIGSVLRNDSQAAGVGIGVGLGFAALGGSMVPLELFPDALQVVSRFTPHAWANQAMAEIVRRDGGVVEVLPQLGALAAFAVVLTVVAVVSLQRSLSR